MMMFRNLCTGFLMGSLFFSSCTIVRAESLRKITMMLSDRETQETLSGYEIALVNSNDETLQQIHCENEMTEVELSEDVKAIHFVSVPDGYYYPQDISTEDISDTLDIATDAFDVKILHQDIVSGKPISGSDMKLYDENNTLAASWKSDESAEGSIPSMNGQIVKLKAGMTYHLQAENIPKKYPNEGDTEIRIPKYGSQQDSRLLFQKSSSPCANLHMEIRDAFNSHLHHVKVYFYEDENCEHPLLDYDQSPLQKETDCQGKADVLLKEGTYFICSVCSELNTYKTVKIKTEVDPAKEDEMTLEIIHPAIRILLESEDEKNGEQLFGGKYQLLDSRMKVLYEWSGEGEIPWRFASGNTYYVKQIKAPSGYILNGETVQFTVSDTAPSQLTPVVIHNSPCEKSEPIKPSPSVPAAIPSVPAKEKKEETKKEEKGKETEKKETASSVKNDTAGISMWTPPAEKKKTDASFYVECVDKDHNPINGASIAVLNESGKMIDQWITDGKRHQVEGKDIEFEQAYTIRQLTAPYGYEKKKTDLVFTMPEASDEIPVLTLTVDKLPEKTTVSPAAELKKSSQNLAYIAFGIGILALGGLGFVLFKRKQLSEEDEDDSQLPTT